MTPAPTPVATAAARPARRALVAVAAAATAAAGLAALQPAPPADAAPAAPTAGRGVVMDVETGVGRTMPRAKVRETGRVRQVADGDTVWVRLDGRRPPGVRKHRKRPWVSVRLAAVQAAETKHANQKGSRNWCHGVPAKKALRTLTKGRRVQLRSLRKGSRASGGRLQRHVYVKRGGRWVDVAEILLAQGHVMAHPMKPEFSRNVRYAQLMQQAMQRGRNMWDPDKCGVGPQQDVPVRIWVAWDAPGLDDQNLNGEYVVVKNESPTQTLNLTGWMLRDTSLEVYRFPAGTTLAPGAFLKLHTGSGRAGDGRYYWGIGHNMWQNPDDEGYGDTAVLMDPQGDYRAHFTYPCLVSCADPMQGKVRIVHVQWDAEGDDNRNVNGEYIQLRNVTRETVDLGGYYVQRGRFVKNEFRPNQRLGPGQTLTLRMGKGQDSDDTMYFNESTSSLNNAGSTVTLSSWTGVRLDCVSWGRGRC